MSNHRLEARFLITILTITVHHQTAWANWGSENHTDQAQSARAGFSGNPPDTLREYILKPGESISAKIKNNLFVRAETRKVDCYLGEPILVTYKLYSRLPATTTIAKHPRLGGFSVYDMTDFISLASSVEMINRKAYKVYVLKKSQLIPLQAGNLSLDPMELDNKVHFIKGDEAQARGNNTLNDLLAQLNNEETAPTIDHNVKILSRSLGIKVHDFPDEGRPANFNGAVGNFKIITSIGASNVTAHTPVILKIEITGSGNIPLLEAPKIDWPAGVDTLDMRSADDFDKSAMPLRGTKTFEFRFSADKAGKYTIPPIFFSFFDPGTRVYKTVSSQPNIFNVSADNNSKEKNLKRNSEAIANDSNTLHAIVSFVKKYWPAALIAVLIALFIIWLRATQRKKNNNALAARATEEKLPLAEGEPGITDVLFNSKAVLESGDYKGFYSSLNAVLWDELIAKLKLPPSEMNRHNIINALMLQGWNIEMTNRLDNVLTKCERSKYLPDYRQDIDTTGMLKLMENVISDLRVG